MGQNDTIGRITEEEAGQSAKVSCVRAHLLGQPELTATSEA